MRPRGGPGADSHSGWGLGLEHRGLGHRAVLSLMAPGLHTRRDGIPTAGQALGHHRVWGAGSHCLQLH